MPRTSCGHCGTELYISEKNAEEGTEVYCSHKCQDAAFSHTDDEPGHLTGAALAVGVLEKSTKTLQYLDVLPARAGGKRIALEWMPAPEEGRERFKGFAILTSARDRTGYCVTEITVSWNGRGFLFTKVSGKGTDKTTEHYCCFVGKDKPTATTCECRGAARHGFCKHIDTCLALIANNWL